MAEDCGPGCKRLRALSDAVGLSALSAPVGGGSGLLGQANAGLHETNAELGSATAGEIKVASGYIDSIAAVEGVFELIKDEQGMIIHRLFVPEI